MTSGSEPSPILVGTDLSDASFAAIRQAAAWAKRHRKPLLVGHVHPGPKLSPDVEAEVRTAIAQQIEELIDEAAEIVVTHGGAHAALIQLASERQASLLVVGASGAGTIRRTLFGSTAASVARYADCPVMVARHSPEHGPILVGTDFSSAVTPAIVAGGNEAKLRGVPLVLMHSIYEPSSPLNLLGPIVISPPRPSTEDVEAQRQAAVTTLESLLAANGADGECLVVVDEPGGALVHHAEKRAASLLVVGTHGRTGFRRMALGSIAESVAEHASCSVLIAREGRE